MEQIGYSRIKNGVELQAWGSQLGRMEGVPDVIVLDGGDRVHGVGGSGGGGVVVSNLADGSKLVPRYGITGPSSNVSVEADRVVVTFPLTAEDFGAAIQAHIDATAKARGYGNGVLLASYTTSTIPQWASEAGTFIAWRDAVWAYAYAQLALVEGAQRPFPTIAEMVSELPAITWPT